MYGRDRHESDDRDPGRALAVGDGRNWSGEGLGRLQGHDLLFGTHLARTLLTYVDHYGDPDAAAATLEISPSTMRHRLSRIREIVGRLSPTISHCHSTPTTVPTDDHVTD